VIARLTGSLWLRWALTAAILIYLFSRIDLPDTVAALVRLRPGHALAVLALVGVDRLVTIARWLVLLRASGAPIAMKSAAWIYLVSSFIGGFLPAGVGADAMRAYVLTTRTAEGHEAIASVAVDRLLGLLSIVAMGLLGAALWTRQQDAALQQAAAIAALLVVAGAVGILWADRAVRLALPTGWQTSRAGLRLLGLTDALGRYRGRRQALFLVLVLSFVVQVLRILQAYLLGQGIGIDVPFSYYLLFMPIGLLMLLLPISVSGFGLPQGVIVWLLRPQGVPESAAFALSTLIVLTGIIGNVPGMWLYLRSRSDERRRRQG
jgi:glycosyltransferase 2 family protein